MRDSRKRARQACVACNTRRVKCNVTEVTEGTRCHNCAERGIDCDVRESRRGKHPRPRHNQIGETFTMSPTAQQNYVSTVSPNRRKEKAVCNPEDIAVIPQHAGTRVNRPRGDGATDTTPSPHQALLSESQSEGGRLLSSREPSSRNRVNSTTSCGSQESHSLGHLHCIDIIPNEATDNLVDFEAQRRQDRISWLDSQGAFAFPQQAHTAALLGWYFQCFHPYCAVVDQLDVWHELHQGTISPLLLNALLFVATTHCDEVTLLNMELRAQKAQWTFYNRAKDLYDADYEGEQRVVLQSVFLLSFWRADPLLEKDARFWLAASISLAQSQGLHRSERGPNAMHGLQKRIWWAIYIRERQCAAALGLPSRIKDEDFDVESLTYDDFERAFDGNVSDSQRLQSISYHVGMVDLSRLLGHVVHSGSHREEHLSSNYREVLRDQLASWKHALPKYMRIGAAVERSPSLHASLLHLAYNNLLILLHLNDHSVDHNQVTEGGEVLQAASQIARIVEYLPPKGTLRHAQVQVTMNLSNALCVHNNYLRHAHGADVADAEHRSKICLLGLQEIQKTWWAQDRALHASFPCSDPSIAPNLLVQPGPSRFQEQSSPTNGARRWSPERYFSQMWLEPERSSTVAGSPWAWSAEQQNAFLLARIGGDAAVGEGGTYDRGIPGLGSSLPQHEEQLPHNSWQWAPSRG